MSQTGYQRSFRGHPAKAAFVPVTASTADNRLAARPAFIALRCGVSRVLIQPRWFGADRNAPVAGGGPPAASAQTMSEATRRLLLPEAARCRSRDARQRRTGCLPGHKT